MCITQQQCCEILPAGNVTVRAAGENDLATIPIDFYDLSLPDFDEKNQILQVGKQEGHYWGPNEEMKSGIKSWLLCPKARKL